MFSPGKLDPSWNNLNTLGVAYYRGGEWKLAVNALEKVTELNGAGGTAFDFLFLAMAHWQLGKKDEARRDFDRAVAWVEKNRSTLDRNQQHSKELRRFRAEAGALLGIKQKNS